ncbi:oxidoreductase [Mucilaginibacter ginsenosidivorax]|uniref:Oxidoreductase n=1 Tax=Mucilaginibacter ginsenosidivorax TaxID=862126 RepID=A0A5B8W3A5_9SPHI|nr:oxidoreductase [Mucilaginibacter ginsenosidivorax]QEC78540.1 oxidoreductase [Mucilaginibacter ginsenosidivorax]
MKKVVLITGASAGMGKEAVKLLLQEGYTVYGAARRVDKMKELLPYGAKVLKMDVSDDDSMVSGINEIIKNEGRIDILINNAGFGAYGAVEDVHIEDARYQLEVNLFGLARLTQLVLPHMRKQHSGKIVNITSIGGKMATPLGGWYHASKYAVEGLSDSLRLEVKPFGIDVILIEPGGIKTEWQDIAMENLEKVSGHTAYQNLTKSAININEKGQKQLTDPVVIAKLIAKAIREKKPGIRYAAGYMTGIVLFLKRWLSDSMFDKMIMSQMSSLQR